MRVVLFTSSNKGGTGRVVSVLADYMYQHGHNVRIVQYNNTSEMHYPLDDAITIIPSSVWDNKTISRWQMLYLKIIKNLAPGCAEGIYANLLFRNKAKGFSAYLNHNQADVVYSFATEANIVLGMAASWFHSVKIISERSYPQRADIKAFTKRIKTKTYACADFCVFQTKEQSNLFPKSVQRKSVIIPNPLRKNLPKPYMRKRRKVIVTYGRLAESKRLDVLLYAFKIIISKFNDFELSIIGSGEYELELKSIISKLELTNYVKIMPFDPDIHEKIKDCSMFVMTSDFEGMPNSLIEAMAIGLPVISTDCLGGGARAVIEDGVNGLLVPRGDVNAVANAMVDLIEHPDKAKKLTQNAIKIRETLSVESISEQWLILLEG